MNEPRHHKQRPSEKNWIRVGVIAGVIAAACAVVGLIVNNAANQPGAPAGSKPITSADQVARCERQHHLTAASTTLSVSTPKALLAADQIHESGWTNTGTIFVTCSWPPAVASDPDGFRKIESFRLPGPGQSEADDDNVMNLIQSPCKLLRVSFSTGHMGTSGKGSLIIANAGYFAYPNGQPWQQEPQGVPIYVSNDQTVLMGNDDQVVDNVTCTR